jgi:iron complex outermembrane receptor protein
VTSKAPSFTPELTAEATLGNTNYHQVRVSASGPLIADKLAIRLTVADTHRDGFLTNRYNATKAQDYDNLSLRGQLLYTPTPSLKFRLIGDYSRQTQAYALILLDGAFTTYANGAPIANNVLQRAARLNTTLPAYGAFARIGNSNSPYQANMKSYGVSGEADWDAGPVTVTSITAYRWWDWYPANDVDGTALSINLKSQQQNFQRQFSQELRVASNGHHVIDYQAGLYYFWQKVPGYGASQFGSDAAAWNLPTGTPAATAALYNLALTNIEADSFSNATTKSVAAFGQIDAHLTDALTLTAGLRFSHEDKTGVYRRFQLPGGLDLSGLTTTQLATVAAIRAAFQLNDFSFPIPNTRSNALTGLATLGYKITPDALAYATYSRGNKSGGLNITAAGAAQPVVAPETVDNFEAGLKTQFLDHKVTFNVAAFLTNVSNYQANVTVPIPGTSAANQYISNIPKVRSKGVEADLSVAPSKWVSLTGSFAYTDARYVSYTNAPNAPENLNIGATQDLSGVALPGVSKYAFTLGADASQPIADGGEVYVHADYLHRSSFNATATNSIYGLIPAYGVLNAKIGFRVDNGRYDFSLWARNLTNKNYYVTRTVSNFGLITAIVGDPRTFGATVRVKL